MALAYAAYTYLSKLILGMFVEGFESLETESLEEQSPPSPPLGCDLLAVAGCV